MSHCWIVHIVEYSALRGLQGFARACPRRGVLWLGDALGALLWLIRFRRGVVDQNLRLVARWDRSEQRRIVRDLYRYMGRYAADMLRLPASMPPLTVEGERALHETRTANGGTLVLFAHFGNWELLMPVLANRLGGLTVIAKPMKNPLVNRWLVSQRATCGFEVAPPGNAVRTALRVLRSGGAVAVAVDQWPGEMGSPCPFLGKVTKTVRTVAGLANLTGCTTLAACAPMETSGHYRVVVQSVPLSEDLPSDDRAAVAAIQQHHNDILSAWIMAAPEHWFGWLHRRFKDLLDY